MSVKMVKKADIVTFKGFDSDKIGLVDKLVDVKGVKHAIIRWIKPIPNLRTYAPVSRLKTLRTSVEAGQRGRKKIIKGLEEGSETYVTRLVREE
jgi:hypothetical protein